MSFGDALHEREPQPGARRARREERGEDAVAIDLGDAFTVVGDLEANAAGIAVGRPPAVSSLSPRSKESFWHDTPRMHGSLVS